MYIARRHWFLRTILLLMGEFRIFAKSVSSMNSNYRKINLTIHIGQFVICALFIFLPSLVLSFEERNFSVFLPIFRKMSQVFAMWMLLYFLNFYLLVPYFLFRKRKTWFFLLNLAVLLLDKLRLFCIDNVPDAESGYFFYWAREIVVALAQCIVVFSAVSARYLIRWNEREQQRQEESRKNTEAELVWLKNQLNPHFLFNTLNNISSLVQVDADMAQESLGQLSELLRYALYESSKEKVPLENEMEFMRNYIDLMRLRCLDSTDIRVDFPSEAPGVSVIPLLFISPIENAFKHGVNNRRPSFVHIRLSYVDGEILFHIENSRHPKPDTDRVGSGIGIENLRRRLELAYPERHTYYQNEDESIYQICITIKP